MKIIVHYNERTKTINVDGSNSTQIELKELTQKVCIFFSITAFSDYALATIPNGTIIDKTNLHFISDGCELMLKFLGGSGSRFVSPPSASFIRADRSNRAAVQNSFLSANNPHHNNTGHHPSSPSHHNHPPAPTPSSPTGAAPPTSASTTPTPTTIASPSLISTMAQNSSNNNANQNNTTAASSSPSSSTTTVSSTTTAAATPSPAVSNENNKPSLNQTLSTSNLIQPSGQQQQPPQAATIDSIFTALHDLSQKKKALFDLKDLLKDENNLKKFIEKDGIRAIEDQMNELSGNTLAYALIAIQSACSYEIGVQSLPTTLINRILAMIADSTAIPSITKTGLSILSSYCQTIPQAASQLNNQYAKAALSSQYPSLFANVVALLSSSTVDIQLNALTLINVILSKSPNELQSLLNKLDEHDINFKLKKLFESNVSQELKKQLYFYQKHKLSILKKRKNIPYSKETPEHEALLMKLWTTTYPDVKLETRVSEQWKLLGFQGTDPATDFRGMGIFGLENLIYIAETHTDQFRKLISSQIERKERDYPVAVAGINLTQLFFELFKVSEDSNPEFPIFPILFSHKNAFEEVYCIAFQLLDITWDTMNASYMEFPKVLASVKQSIITALETKPTTLEAFNWAAGASKKTNTFQNDDESSIESEDIKKLKQIIKTEMVDIVKTQKLNILNDGIYFKLQKPVKGKTTTHTHLFVYQPSLLVPTAEIQYAYCTDPAQPIAGSSQQSQQSQTPQPPMSPGSSARSELTGSGGLLPPMPSSPTLSSSGGIGAGSNSGSSNSGSNANSSNSDLHRAAMSFTIIKSNDIHFPAQSADQQQRRKPDNNKQNANQQTFFTVNFGKEIVELIATNREDHSNFVDSIRLLNNKQFECPETIEEYKTLVNLSMKIKLLDLEGIELPKTAPTIPALPSDFFFISKDTISPNNSFIKIIK